MMVAKYSQTELTEKYYVLLSDKSTHTVEFVRLQREQMLGVKDFNFDSNISNMVASHPNSPELWVKSAVNAMVSDRYTIAEVVDFLKILLTNKKWAIEKLNDFISMDIIPSETLRHFYMALTQIMHQSTGILTSMNLQYMLHDNIAFISSYELDVIGVDVMTDYYISLFDSPSFSTEVVLSKLVKNMHSLPKLPTTQRGCVFNAIKTSKRAFEMLQFLHVATKDDIYICLPIYVRYFYFDKRIKNANKTRYFSKNSRRPTFNW